MKINDTLRLVSFQPTSFLPQSWQGRLVILITCFLAITALCLRILKKSKLMEDKGTQTTSPSEDKSIGTDMTDMSNKDFSNSTAPSKNLPHTASQNSPHPKFPNIKELVLQDKTYNPYDNKQKYLKLELIKDAIQTLNEWEVPYVKTTDLTSGRLCDQILLPELTDQMRSETDPNKRFIVLILIAATKLPAGHSKYFETLETDQSLDVPIFVTVLCRDNKTNPPSYIDNAPRFDLSKLKIKIDKFRQTASSKT